MCAPSASGIAISLWLVKSIGSEFVAEIQVLHASVWSEILTSKVHKRTVSKDE